MADPLLDCAACGASLDCQDEIPPLPSGPICINCTPAIECRDTDPIDYYSLEGPTFGYVINCPPGYDCSHSTEVHIVCCERELVAKFPPGATPAQRKAIVDDLVSRCNLALEFCGGPKDTLYYNKAVSASSLCPGSGVPSTGTWTATVPAGTFIGKTQAEADKLATDFLGLEVLINRFCINPAPLCFFKGTTATRTDAITGGTRPFKAGLVSGHSPVGLVLTAPAATVSFTGSALTPGRYNPVVFVTDSSNGTWSGALDIHVVAMDYSTTTTAPFTTPAVSSTVVVAFTSVANLTVGQTVTIGTVVSGYTMTEAGQFTVASIATLNVTLTFVAGTPTKIFATGAKIYWSVASTLPNVTAAVPYSFQLPAAGGDGIYTFTLVSGTLPGGLTLSSSGLISGTPTGVAGTTLTIGLGDSKCPGAGTVVLNIASTLVSTGPPVPNTYSIGASGAWNSNHAVPLTVSPITFTQFDHTQGTLTSVNFNSFVLGASATGSQITINSPNGTPMPFPPGYWRVVQDMVSSLTLTAPSGESTGVVNLNKIQDYLLGNQGDFLPGPTVYPCNIGAPIGNPANFSVSSLAPYVDTYGPAPVAVSSTYSHSFSSDQVGIDYSIRWDAGTNFHQSASFTITYNFSMPYYTFSGKVFNDLNNDGIMEPTEPGIAGCTVSLLIGYVPDGSDAVPVTGVAAIVTDAGGGFAFVFSHDVADLYYTVRVTNPPGGTLTFLPTYGGGSAQTNDGGLSWDFTIATSSLGLLVTTEWNYGFHF